MLRRVSSLAPLYAHAVLLGCGAETPPGRVLLLGVDGASMRVVGPLLAAGRLPNLQALSREAGVHGTIRSQLPSRLAA